jgi:hypothetical protein
MRLRIGRIVGGSSAQSDAYVWPSATYAGRSAK